MIARSLPIFCIKRKKKKKQRSPPEKGEQSILSPSSCSRPEARSREMDREKLMKMAGAVRTGGKGTARRKQKALGHKAPKNDDKRLQSTLKKIGLKPIPAIEEVNIFKDDSVIHFTNPLVQASIAANTWVFSGTAQTKKLQEILPNVINQLGPDNLRALQKIMSEYSKVAGKTNDSDKNNEEDEDDEVPELVDGESFEKAAES